MIINEQKHYWFWDERLFYVYSDGSIIELAFYFKKGVVRHYLTPRKFQPSKIVARFICKSKVDKATTVQTGKLTYLK